MLIASPLVAVPAASAASGGAGTSPAGGASPAPAGPPVGTNASTPQTPATGGAPTTSAGSARPQDGDLVATATGDGITVTTTVSALLGHQLAFTGITSPAAAGDVVVVQRLDPTAGWINVAAGAVAPGGIFSVVWRTDYVGRLTMRTVLGQTAAAADASQAAGSTSPTLQITVYRPGLATLYGKGFFGQQTACGQTLRRATLGVASRTLRCGTEVQIYYGGLTIVVPVIDRGPYANKASWDLTQATAKALGMSGTATVGAVAGLVQR